MVGPPTDLEELKARRAMAKAVDNFIETDIVLKIPDVELGPSLKVTPFVRFVYEKGVPYSP